MLVRVLIESYGEFDYIVACEQKSIWTNKLIKTDH